MSSLTPFCPRCGGKMYHIRDLFGEYDNCINCGYHRDIFEGPPIALKAPEPVGGRPKRKRNRTAPTKRQTR